MAIDLEVNLFGLYAEMISLRWQMQFSNKINYNKRFHKKHVSYTIYPNTKWIFMMEVNYEKSSKVCRVVRYSWSVGGIFLQINGPPANSS